MKEKRWVYRKIEFNHRDRFDEANDLIGTAKNVGNADQSFTFFDEDEYEKALKVLKDKHVTCYTTNV